MTNPVARLCAENATRRYPTRRRTRRAIPSRPALDNVTLTLAAGSTTALVGSSGAGKTTLVRCLLALDPLDGGQVTCQGRPVRPGPVSKLRWFRRLAQYVPQDPAATLDPNRRVRDLVAEPVHRLRVPGDPDALVAAALAEVGLDLGIGDRRPTAISGGQAQRVAIARSLVTRPAVLVADEPVSGLDLPLRQQVLDVLTSIHRESGISILLVSHDLAAVARVCEQVVVMDQGRVVEAGPTGQIFTNPAHPATQRLLDAIPRIPGRPASAGVSTPGVSTPGVSTAGVSTAGVSTPPCHTAP